MPNKNERLIKKMVVSYPFLLIIPFNLGLYLPGFALLNVQRVYYFLLIPLWLYILGPLNGIKRIFQSKNATFIFIGFFVIPFLSITNSVYPEISRQLVFSEKYLFVIMSYTLGYWYLSSVENLNRFLKVIMYSVIIMNVVAIIQYLINYDFTYEIVNKLSSIPEQEYSKFGITKYFEDRAGLSRIKAFFPHPIGFGVFIASFTTVFLHSFKFKIIKSKVILYLGMITSLIAIYITVSRTPLFLLLALLLLYILNIKSKFSTYFLALFVFICLYFIYVFFENIGFGYMQDSGRTLLLLDFIAYFGQNGLLGIGPGMFSNENQMLYRYFTIVDPMAFSLTMIIEVGLLFIPIYITIIYNIFRTRISFNRNKQLDEEPRQLGILLSNILLANILVSFASLSIINASRISSILFWMILGAYLGLERKVFKLNGVSI